MTGAGTAGLANPGAPAPRFEDRDVLSPERAILPGVLRPLDPAQLYRFGFEAGWRGEQGAVMKSSVSTLPLSSLLQGAAALCRDRGSLAEIDTSETPPLRSGVWVRCEIRPDGHVAVWAWNHEGAPKGTLRLATHDDLAPQGEVSPPATFPTIALLELDALPPFLELLLSPRERSRACQLGERRRKMFAAGRVALKLATAPCLPFAALDTLAEDGRLARAPVPGLGSVSIAHDRRLAVGAASEHGKLGIDVEAATPRLEKATRLYAAPSELAAAKDFAQGLHPGLARIWTTKEAVTKATGLTLGEVFSRCQLTRLGVNSSVAVLDGTPFEASHTEIDEHLLTVTELS